MSIREEIENCLESALKSMGVSSPPSFEVMDPKDPSHGDYSTNIAFSLSKVLNSSPEKIAEKILSNLNIESGHYEKIENTSGFINFTLNWKTLREGLLEILKKGEDFGRMNLGEGERILVEFVSANPTGPLVVANARAAVLGDSLVRLLNFLGYQAKREYYVDDGGNQVELLGRSLEVRFREFLGERVSLPKEGYGGEYVREMARRWLPNKDDVLRLGEEERVKVMREWGVKEILEGQKKSLERYQVKFDHFVHESSFRRSGKVKEVVEDLKRGGETFEDGGALWFRGTNFGDDRDRVIIKSNGEATYLVPDLAYHVNKFERGFSHLINLFGPDHLAHIPSLKAGLKALGYPSERIAFLVVQWVTLLRGGEKVGMSKRAGEFITMDELLDEIGVDSVRFLLLMRRPSSHLDFDIEEAKKQSEENPVYYVQYGHARIASILKFAEEKVGAGLILNQVQDALLQEDLNFLKEEEERDLLRKLRKFPEILLECKRENSPHPIPYYLHETATLFHHFYQKHRVVTEDLPLTKARILLVKGVQAVLQNGLSLIGVSAPEKM